MVSPTDQGGGAGGAAAIAVQAVQPQVVTEAQQTGINEVRLQAELYKLQMDQRIHQQQQDVAQCMGNTLQQQYKQQPHVSYSIYNNTYQPPPQPPSTPIPAGPGLEVEVLRQKIREERQVNQQKLHEATAATNQTVTQMRHGMVAEARRAENMARQAASAASTDDIRKSRAAADAGRVFNEQLSSELREARVAAAAAKGEVSSMKDEKRQFFEQQMTNEMENTIRQSPQAAEGTE